MGKKKSTEIAPESVATSIDAAEPFDVTDEIGVLTPEEVFTKFKDTGFMIVETDESTGDIHADVLSYVGRHRSSYIEAIDLPYPAEDIQAVVSFLKSQGKLNGDGSRVWV